jgi:hypothetical protein
MVRVPFSCRVAQTERIHQPFRSTRPRPTGSSRVTLIDLLQHPALLPESFQRAFREEIDKMLRAVKH